jgi:quercetin dioxygenase-like cupin family protein
MSFVNLVDIEEKEVVPGFRGKFIHADNITVAHWTITAGAELPDHAHPHEQITILVKGDFEFTLADQVKRISAGESVAIPSNLTHKGKALTDCYVIDVFYPVREDYRVNS